MSWLMRRKSIRTLPTKWTKPSPNCRRDPLTCVDACVDPDDGLVLGGRFSDLDAFDRSAFVGFADDESLGQRWVFGRHLVQPTVHFTQASETAHRRRTRVGGIFRFLPFLVDDALEVLHHH